MRAAALARKSLDEALGLLPTDAHRALARRAVLSTVVAPWENGTPFVCKGPFEVGDGAHLVLAVEEAVMALVPRLSAFHLNHDLDVPVDALVEAYEEDPCGLSSSHCGLPGSWIVAVVVGPSAARPDKDRLKAHIDACVEP